MGHDAWGRVRLAAGTLAVTLGLAAMVGGGVAAANPPHITVGVYPSCTRSALQAGLSRGFATVRGAKIGSAFGCRQAWAYAEVNTKRFTLTSVFHVRDGRWITVRREPACTKHAVPRRIYKAACETN